MTVTELIEILQRYLREHPYSETTRVAVDAFEHTLPPAAIRLDDPEIDIVQETHPNRATLRIR